MSVGSCACSITTSHGLCDMYDFRFSTQSWHQRLGGGWMHVKGSWLYYFKTHPTLLKQLFNDLIIGWAIFTPQGTSLFPGRTYVKRNISERSHGHLLLFLKCELKLSVFGRPHPCIIPSSATPRKEPDSRGDWPQFQHEENLITSNEFLVTGNNGRDWSKDVWGARENPTPDLWGVTMRPKIPFWDIRSVA